MFPEGLLPLLPAAGAWAWGGGRSLLDGDVGHRWQLLSQLTRDFLSSQAAAHPARSGSEKHMPGKERGLLRF